MARRVKILGTHAVWLALLATGVSAQETANAPRSAIELRAVGRELAADNWTQNPDGSLRGDTIAKEKLKKVAEGLPSLLLPGWSQWRQGNHTRAALLAGAEAGVWASWVIFRVQGGRREDSYEEYAVNFAGVSGVAHNDDYWKALAVYISSEDYNENRRLDLRAGGEIDGPAYDGDLAWRWRSPIALAEYRRLRTSSLGAFDHAENVLAFALLTRAIAVIDAVRTALVSDGDGAISSGRMGLHLHSQSIDGEPAAELGLRLSF
jgi:hypothetical protein